LNINRRHCLKYLWIQISENTNVNVCTTYIIYYNIKKKNVVDNVINGGNIFNELFVFYANVFAIIVTIIPVNKNYIIYYFVIVTI